MPTFSQAAQAILRLSLLPGAGAGAGAGAATLPHISKLLAEAVGVLKRLENGVDFPESWIVVRKDGEDTADAPPYTSRGLHPAARVRPPISGMGHLGGGVVAGRDGLGEENPRLGCADV